MRTSQNYKNREQLDGKRLDILFGRGKILLLSNAGAALLAVLVFWKLVDHVFMLLWLPSFAIVLIGRIWFSSIYNKGAIQASRLVCYQIYNAGAALNGLLWGVLGIFLSAQASSSYMPIILVIVCGLIAVSLLLNSIAFHAFIAFAYPAAVPIITYFLLYDQIEMKFLGMLATLNLAVLTMVAYYMNRIIFSHLSSEEKKADLLKKLDQEKELIVELNTDLMNELLRQKLLKEELQTENEKVEELANRLKALSATDGLTDIPNRRRFDEFLSKEWGRSSRSQTPLSLILCDVDCFKAFNDYYGHLSGDQCLKDVATLLAEHARRSGDIAARYGGEEFTVVLSNTNINDAHAIAEQMRQGIEGLGIRHQASTVAEFVTASFGVASIIPTFEVDSAMLIAKADHALYQAKQGGKNTVVIEDSILSYIT